MWGNERILEGMGKRDNTMRELPQEVETMKISRFILVFLILALSAGCATTSSQQAQTSSLLGAIGAGAGAGLDGDNRWRGALLGGLAGMVTGYGLATINEQHQPYQAPLPSAPPAQPQGSYYYQPGASYYPQQSYNPQYPSYSNPNGYHPYRAPYCIYCY